MATPSLFGVDTFFGKNVSEDGCRVYDCSPPCFLLLLLFARKLDIPWSLHFAKSSTNKC